MIIWLSIFFILIVTNLFSGYFNVFYLGLYHPFKFETTNGEFSATLHFGQSMKMEDIENRFESFKQDNPTIENVKLYRNFKINVLEFWNWYRFATHPMYRYPYKKPT